MMMATTAASTGDSAVLPLPPRAPSGDVLRDLTSMIPREALVARIGRGQDAETQLAAAEDERRFLTGQKIREEQRITERLAQEAVGLEEQLGRRSKEAQETRRAQTVAEPEFKPSKMELDDYRNLAGMLVGLGMLAGTSGKSGAMYALNSLNGMMKGFAEGRRDLFKNEQVQFEKQLKSIEATNKRVQRDFEDAMSLLQTDRQLGLAKMQRLKAELGNSVAGIALQLNDLDAVRSNLQRQVTSSEKATADLAKLIEMQKAREARAATEKERLDEARLRREETERSHRAMERIAAQRLAEPKQTQNKPLTASEIRKLEGLDSISKGLQELSRDFKPQFANLGFLTVGADFSLELKRRGLSTDKFAQEAVAWWSQYNRLQAPNRHALFGATLTGNELTNYRSFTAKPSDAANVIRNSLKDQMTYSSELARSQRQSFERAGYKVPPVSDVNYLDSFRGGTQATTPASTASAPSKPDDIAQQARELFGAYEPDIYEYGINPATLKFARRERVRDEQMGRRP